MLAFAPAIAADETVRSYVERLIPVATHRACSSRTKQDFICARTIHATMPQRLQMLCQCLEDVCGCANQLIDGHTHFPYYFSTASKAQADIARRRMLESSFGCRVPSRAMLHFAFDERVIPYCASCDAETRQLYGDVVEYRTHLLPFQRCCPIHEELLAYRNRESPTILQNTFQQHVAKQKFRQVEFDCRSAALLHAEVGAATSSIDQMLCEKRYRDEKGRLHKSALTHDLTQFYSDGFADQRLSLLAVDGRFYGRYLNLWNKATGIASPVGSILLLWFLSRCEALSIERYRVPTQGGHRTRAAERIQELASQTSSQSLRNIAKNEEVSYRSLLDHSIRNGSAVNCRPKTFHSEAQEDACAQLVRGVPRHQVALNFQVSLSTVNRLCIRRDIHKRKVGNERTERSKIARQHWCDAYAANPNKTRTGIRHAIGADWTWLSRHDVEWLKASEAKCILATSARHRGNNYADKKIRRAASCAFDLVTTRPGIPARSTGTAVSRQAGVSNYVMARRCEMSVYSETDDQWVSRRLTWAFSNLNEEGLSFEACETNIWRLARIRKRRNRHLDFIVSTIFDPDSER